MVLVSAPSVDLRRIVGEVEPILTARLTASVAVDAWTCQGSLNLHPILRVFLLGESNSPF